MKIKQEVEGKEQALKNLADFFAQERIRIESGFSKNSDRFIQFERSIIVAREKAKARLVELSILLGV
ncbi:hypothetical protein [Robertmurraya sp.]|uniref:hypothetical protein n=1 Tax=Robertmurraya sp. TaxID=2837525 RepID=UPI003703E83B